MAAFRDDFFDIFPTLNKTFMVWHDRLTMVMEADDAEKAAYTEAKQAAPNKAEKASGGREYWLL